MFAGFTFSGRLLFCIIFLCFVCSLGSFCSRSPYLFCCSGNCFLSVAHVLAPGASSSGFYHLRSGTVFAKGASFGIRVLLMVQDRFWLWEPALQDERY